MTASDRARVRRIADGIVAAHAGYRRRVRWAIAAGAAVAVVAAVPALLVVNQPRDYGGSSAGGRPEGALPTAVSGTEVRTAPRTYAPLVIGSSQGAGGVTDFASALRRWRPHGIIRVFRPATTPAQRVALRTAFGSRVHFVGTREHAAVLDRWGGVSLPRASSTRGSSS